MRRLFAAGACALGLLAFAGPASADVSVGVNDDAGKYAGGDPQFWTTMQSAGLRQDAVTVLWDETQPTSILDESFIAAGLPAAQDAGIEVVFDVYPLHSHAFTDGGATPQQFAAFLTKLAQTFPTVTEYVVMNECNQTRFVNPQFDARGVNQSAALCGQALAAGYDALKAVNPEIVVWGIGLSPRGNDNAAAASNASTSPVKFLGALGKWYRSSGRTIPIMDGFDFHPYPIPQSLPFATGYADTDNAAVANLRRIYQAFYDAFKGTAQPTIGQQPGGGLPVSLNEVGIQTDSTGRPDYTGVETAGDANGGVRGKTATEQFQSDWYVQMLNLVACDANVKVVNIFHLVDESDLGGWQSGLYYVGYAPKASAAAVQSWLAQTGGNCLGWGKGWVAAGSSQQQTALDALLASGAFRGVRTGAAGNLSGILGRPDFAAVLGRLWGPDPSPPTDGSLGSIGARTRAYRSLSRSLFQLAPLPNLRIPAQALTDVLTLAAGKLATATQITATLQPCGRVCSAQGFARVALRPPSRAAASTAAVGPLTIGRAAVRAGMVAKVAIKSVRGSRRSYGRYALVVRLDGASPAVRPAAIAVTFTVSRSATTG